ncbi:MAG TPA: molybdopterin-dependent oxidoreductase, partial [Anaerolineales bacterium]
DEITKTGEFGIFNRGDHAELGIYPGQVLNNAYSANVVDICPVGALTERDFRFKTRVWYLSSGPTVCNGCSQGCNIDLHYVLDRPHLNDGSRVVRIKPRYNAEVNQWWLCDEGRYGFGWVDRGRLEKVRGPASNGKEATADVTLGATWEQALTAIAAALAGLKQSQQGSRIGVIASAQSTNEELFLIREIFQNELGAQVSAAVPGKPGTSDDFLIKADKYPNTRGATLLGLAGPEAADAGEILDQALSGKLEVLWVFGHDLSDAFQSKNIAEMPQKVRLFIFSGTNANPTASLAHWVLPSAAYVEKDGTYVNCHGRVQRIGCAFPPLKDSREDWRILLGLAGKLGLPCGWKGPEDIFGELAGSVAAFEGLTYKSIGTQGAALETGKITPGVDVR